jgi:DNA-binding MarR family transcriptional regulator
MKEKNNLRPVPPGDARDPARVIYDLDLSRQDQSFSFRMRELVKLFVRGNEIALRKHKVTSGQWHFLRALWEQEGRSQAELSDILGTTSSATVFSINLLERDGLAHRVPDSEDQRRYLIYLTPKGQKLREQLLPHAREIQLTALDGFSADEVRLLDDFMTRMKQNLQKRLDAEDATKPAKRGRRGAAKKG